MLVKEVTFELNPERYCFNNGRLWREVESPNMGNNRWDWEKQGVILLLGIVRTHTWQEHSVHRSEEGGRKTWKVGWGKL